MTRTLVTGGLGFIGSALVRRLVREGHRVRVIDNAARGNARRLADVAPDVEIRTVDVRDTERVVEACVGVDAIWHLAAINGTAFFYSVPDLVLDVGIRGALNVMDGALRHSVGRLFFASSSEVYQTPPQIPTPERVALTIPDPHNPRYSYAGSKIASELLLLNQGRSAAFERVVIFRPHNVYGPDMGWEHAIPQLTMLALERARSGPGPLSLGIQGTGEETRAFCFVDDAIDGMHIASQRGEHLGIYNVGSDVETRIADLATAIGRQLDRTVEVVPGPPAPGSPVRRCPDISRLRALGFAPHVTLAEGLARTIPWYDEHAEEQPRDDVDSSSRLRPTRA